MAKQVDQRIVQMQFDNKKFEQGVQTTLQSINKLDTSLNALNNISLKGFEKIGQFANKIDLSAIGNAADLVSSRMSSMGIVGATVLQNLTNSAINTAKSLSSITIGQIMTGGKNRALNIEAAKFQLEGLGVAWDKIEKDISYGVKDTAYGLDAAAKAASQLVASQVQLGDEMRYSLRGISGVAAMTNSSYEDIANIFTTVAGNGRLYAQQLMQFSSRGLNAAATLAKALGKSEAEIREMVSKGKIDFKTFAKAMDDAFGEHAKDANKTFTGALSNMKAALSRVGAEFYTPGLEYMRDIFNSITAAVDRFKSSLASHKIFEDVSNIMATLSKYTTDFFYTLGDDKGSLEKVAGKGLDRLHKGLEFIQSILSNGTFINITSSLKTITSYTFRLFQGVVDGIKSMFSNSIKGNLVWIGQKMKEFSERFKKSSSQYYRIKNIVEGLVGALQLIFKYASAALRIFWNLFGDSISSKIQSLIDWLAELGRKIRDFSKEQDPFTEWYNKIENLRPKLDEIKQTIDKNIERINAKFKENFGKTIPETIDVLKKKLHDLFFGEKDPTKKQIDWFNLLSIAIEGVTKALEFLIDVFGLFYNGFGGNAIFESLSNGIDGIIDKINGLKAFIGGDDSLLQSLSPGLNEFLTDARDIFNNFKKIISDAFGYVKPVIKGFVNTLKTVSFEDIMQSGGLAVAIVGIKKLIDFLITYKTKLAWIDAIASKKDEKVAFLLKEEVNKITGAFSSISGFFNQLKANFKQDKSDELILRLAAAVGILAVSMMILSNIDREQLIATLGVVTALFTELIAAFKYLDKTTILNENPFKDMTLTMIGLSVALLLVASALKKVSKIDPEKLGSSFFVLSGMMAELAGSIYLLSMVKGDIPKIGGTLLAVAAAVLILASALKKVSSINPERLLPSITALIVLLAELAGTLYLLTLMSDAGSLAGIAASMILVAVALNMMILPLAAMALMGDRLWSSISGLALLLGLLGSFTAIMTMVEGGGLGLAGIGAGLIVLAAGLTLLMVPLVAMAAMGDRVGPAISGLAMLLLLLGSFTAIMTLVEGGGLGLAAIGAGLIVFATGLSLLMVPLAALAAMDQGAIDKALGAFATILVLLGVMVGFAAALSGFAAGILAVAAAIALVGVGVAGLGVGIAGLGVGIYFVVAAFNLLVRVAMFAGDALVNLAITAAFAIIAFMTTLGDASVQVTESVGKLIIALCDAIMNSSVKIIDTILTLLIKLLDALTDKVPTMILDLLELVIMVLDGLLKGLTQYVPVLARDLYNFCMTLLDETVKLIKQTPMDLVDIFFGGGFDKDKNQGKKLGDWFKGIFSKNKDDKDVKEAGKEAADVVVDSASEAIDSSESQKKLGGSLNGLVAGAGKYLEGNTVLSDSMSEMTLGALDAGDDALDIKNGRSMESFRQWESVDLGGAEGLMKNQYLEKAMDEKDAEVLKRHQKNWDQHSPSRVMMKSGKFIDEGLAIGLASSNASEKAIGNKATGLMRIFDTVGESISNMRFPTDGLLSALLDSSNDPVITPILDLTNVNSGMSTLSSMLNENTSFRLAGEAASLQDANRFLSLQIQNDNTNNLSGGLSGLRSDINKLGEAMMNTQMVMDTGEVVGVMANPMDRELGRRAIQVKRGGARR